MSVHSLGLGLLAQPPERICSKLVFGTTGVRNQSHLVRTARPGPSVDSPANQGSANIQRVYQVFSVRQALVISF